MARALSPLLLLLGYGGLSALAQTTATAPSPFLVFDGVQTATACQTLIATWTIFNSVPADTLLTINVVNVGIPQNDPSTTFSIPTTAGTFLSITEPPVTTPTVTSTSTSFPTSLPPIISFDTVGFTAAGFSFPPLIEPTPTTTSLPTALPARHLPLLERTILRVNNTITTTWPGNAALTWTVDVPFGRYFLTALGSDGAYGQSNVFQVLEGVDTTCLLAAGYAVQSASILATNSAVMAASSASVASVASVSSVSVASVASASSASLASVASMASISSASIASISSASVASVASIASLSSASAASAAAAAASLTPTPTPTPTPTTSLRTPSPTSTPRLSPGAIAGIVLGSLAFLLLLLLLLICLIRRRRARGSPNPWSERRFGPGTGISGGKGRGSSGSSGLGILAAVASTGQTEANEKAGERGFSGETKRESFSHSYLEKPARPSSVTPHVLPPLSGVGLGLGVTSIFPFSRAPVPLVDEESSEDSHAGYGAGEARSSGDGGVGGKRISPGQIYSPFSDPTPINHGSIYDLSSSTLQDQAYGGLAATSSQSLSSAPSHPHPNPTLSALRLPPTPSRAAIIPTPIDRPESHLGILETLAATPRVGGSPESEESQGTFGTPLEIGDATYSFPPPPTSTRMSSPGMKGGNSPRPSSGLMRDTAIPAPTPPLGSPEVNKSPSIGNPSLEVGKTSPTISTGSTTPPGEDRRVGGGVKRKPVPSLLGDGPFGEGLERKGSDGSSEGSGGTEREKRRTYTLEVGEPMV